MLVDSSGAVCCRPDGTAATAPCKRLKMEAFMTVLSRSKWIAGLALALGLLLSVGCQQKTAGTQATPIAICQYGDLLIYLPLYIAQDQGYFNKEGLDVKFINGGGDDKTYAAVA